MIHSFIYIMILDIDIEREIITKSAINQKFACNTHLHMFVTFIFIFMHLQDVSMS